MKTIYVCIGSACHLKGSYSVIKGLQKAIIENKIEDKVTLKAVFCLGHCTQGVSVRIDDEEKIHSVGINTVDEFFRENVLAVL